MTLTRFYIRKRKIIIPTVVQTGDGLYVESAPVKSFEIANEELLRQSLQALICSENEQASDPGDEVEPSSPILEHLDLRRWEAFEKEAVLYTVHRTDEGVNVYVTGRGADRMWDRTSGQHQSFDANFDLGVVVDYLIDNIKSQSESKEPERPLPMLLSPPKKLD